MATRTETAALIALLRGRDGWSRGVAKEVSNSGSALATLDDEYGLFAAERLELARAELEAWEERGIHALCPDDEGYPALLYSVPDPPPILFVAGRLMPADNRAVAVVGSRRASARGLRVATAVAEHLVASGYTVASGLASGIDTAAHTAALRYGGRTLAVLGTGLDHCYPRENARLQREIARHCAIVSQFWPESGPRRESFPLRNAVTAGLTLASVIVEASHTSGARIQARLALEQGREVMLHASLLDQLWARDMASRPGASVVRTPTEITDRLGQLAAAGRVTAAQGA